MVYKGIHDGIQRYTWWYTKVYMMVYKMVYKIVCRSEQYMYMKWALLRSIGSFPGLGNSSIVFQVQESDKTSSYKSIMLQDASFLR